MEKRIPTLFYFGFFIDPEDDETTLPSHIQPDEEGYVHLAFVGHVDDSDKERISHEIDCFDAVYAELNETLEEEYGVHDWGSTPDQRILTLGAYHSYEVNPQKIDELLAKWNSGLKSFLGEGAQLSEPVQIKIDVYNDTDYDLYQKTCAALKIEPLL